MLFTYGRTAPTVPKTTATRTTPSTMRLRMSRLSVGIARPYSIEKRVRTTARTMSNTRSRRYAVARTLATARYEDRVELYGRISVPSHAPPRYRSVVKVVHEKELISVSVPTAWESDQNGSARDTKTRRTARPRAIREGPSTSTRGIHVRKGDPKGIGLHSREEMDK